MTPEAKGTNEASRKAENTLTGHTGLFFLLLDKDSSPSVSLAPSGRRGDAFPPHPTPLNSKPLHESKP